MTDKGIRPYMCSVCGAPGWDAALLGVALLTVAAHTISLPITDPED